MRKRSKIPPQNSPVRNYHQIHKPKPGEMVFVPVENAVYHEDLIPEISKWSKPDWWDEMSSDEGSLKRCSGIGDFMSRGVMLKMWHDLHVRPSSDGRNYEAVFDSEKSLNMRHEENTSALHVSGFMYHQTGACPIADARGLPFSSWIKVVNPWHPVTAPGYSTMILPNMLDPSPHYTVLPGVVHTDFYHITNLVLRITSREEFVIKAGTPIAQLIVFKRSDDIKNIYLEDETALKYCLGRSFGGAFIPKNMRGKYNRRRRELDEMYEQTKKRGIWRRK